MLRSKFHRPWQPRVSDGQLLNPSAQTQASETSFSDAIEEAEEQVHTPESPAADPAHAPSSAIEDVEALRAVAEEVSAARSSWYARLRGRLAGH